MPPDARPQAGPTGTSRQPDIEGNPTAHAAKVRWAVHEADALDMLAQASTFHRRLDDAIVTPAAPVHLRHAA